MEDLWSSHHNNTYSKSDTMSHGENEGQEIVSFQTKEVLLKVIYITILFFCLVGVVTNLINIRVFLYQGVMSDSTTVFMFGMAVSDFLACLTLIPTCVCYICSFVDLTLLHNCTMATALPFRIPHLAFTRITAFIYLGIAVERAFCVLFPFKVHRFVKPLYSSILVVAIYVFFPSSYAPYYISVELKWIFHPNLNTTLLQILDSQATRSAQRAIIIANGFVLTNIAMVVVAIATIILVHRVRASRQWRLAKTSANRDVKSHSSREIEGIRAVIGITSVHLMCMTANLIQMTAAVTVPGYSYDGLNKNLFDIFYAWIYFCNAINSAANFFVYIQISSRYHQALVNVFKRR